MYVGPEKKRTKGKKTTDNLSFIRINNSCASKDPKMKVKRPSANGEKKKNLQIISKKFVSTTYKEAL